LKREGSESLSKLGAIKDWIKPVAPGGSIHRIRVPGDKLSTLNGW
jgi:hypothetical protein